MKQARMASYEKISYYENGGSLYIWTTPEAKADIQLENITQKQAKEIIKTYGLTKMSIQR